MNCKELNIELCWFCKTSMNCVLEEIYNHIIKFSNSKEQLTEYFSATFKFEINKERLIVLIHKYFPQYESLLNSVCLLR
jgi:hypothetical protein